MDTTIESKQETNEEDEYKGDYKVTTYMGKCTKLLEDKDRMLLFDPRSDDFQNFSYNGKIGRAHV